MSGQYAQGRDALTSGYGKAGDLYSSLLSSNNAGANAYGDASGANGPAGNARATANFQANPGYQFQMDQGQQALNRSHAAAGNLSSGNADTDTLKFSQGLANQSYGGYLAGLQPYLSGQQQATAGAANVDTGLAGNLNQSFQGQGGAANANLTGQGASNAAATMNNYNVGANQLGALLGVGNLISGGMGGGLTGGLSGLFSGFGGTPTGATNPGSMGGVRYPQF